MKKVSFTLFVFILAVGIGNASAVSGTIIWNAEAKPGELASMQKVKKLSITIPDDIGFDSGQVELERAMADALNNSQFNIRDNTLSIGSRGVELNKKSWPIIVSALKAGTLTVTPKVAQ